MTSEFSGYRTAELAIESIVGLCERKGHHRISCTSTSADIDKACQKLIGDNCLFGDILEVLPSWLRLEVGKENIDQIVVSYDDIQTAYKLQPKMSAAAAMLFTSQHRLKYALGEAQRDFRLVGVEGQPDSWTAAVRALQQVSMTPGAWKRFTFARRTLGWAKHSNQIQVFSFCPFSVFSVFHYFFIFSRFFGGGGGGPWQNCGKTVAKLI